MEFIETPDLELIYDAEQEFLATSGAGALKVTREAFIAHYADSPGLRFMQGPNCVGSLLIKDSQIHIGVLLEHQGAWVHYLPELFEWCLKIANPLMAVIAANNHKAIALVHRTGWHARGEVGIEGLGRYAVFTTSKQFCRYLRRAENGRRCPPVPRRATDAVLGSVKQHARADA